MDLWIGENSRALALKVIRELTDDRGIVDEVAMRALFDANDIPLADRLRIWRSVTRMAAKIARL